MRSESLRREQEPAVQRRTLTSAELQAQIDEFLARGGQIQEIPIGAGDYWEQTLTERENRKRLVMGLGRARTRQRE